MSVKSEIRKSIKERVSALSPMERRAMSEAIEERVTSFPEYLGARSIFIYHSTSDEPDTRSLIGRALSEGKQVFLPRIEGEEMALVPYRTGDTLRVGPFGIEEPVGEPSRVTPDLAVVPLVAFDQDKHRLGRGKGYYDRFLARYDGCSIALAFSAQEWAAIPVEHHDVSPTVVITDKECIR